MWSATPAGGMGPGFDSLRERAIKFSKDNAEAAFALAEELAQAKDMQHLMTLQSQYAQAQMRSYAAQTQELGRLMTDALQSMKSSSFEAEPTPRVLLRKACFGKEPKVLDLRWKAARQSGRR